MSVLQFSTLLGISDDLREKHDTIFNSFFDCVEVGKIECARRPVSAIIEDTEQLKDVLHVIFNKLLERVFDHTLAMEEIPNLGTTRRIATFGFFASWQHRKYVGVRSLYFEDLREYLASTCAKMASSIWVFRIQREDCAIPAVIEVMRDIPQTV